MTIPRLDGVAAVHREGGGHAKSGEGSGCPKGVWKYSLRLCTGLTARVFVRYIDKAGKDLSRMSSHFVGGFGEPGALE